jgi:membrane-associated phospholipid phosphatase
MAYVGIEAVLILAFMSAKVGWYLLFGMYVSAAVMTVLVTMMSYRGPIWRTIRLIYPLVIMTFLYEALKTQVFMMHGTPFDSNINAFEMAVLGFDSSFALQPHMTVWRNEIFSVAYMSYYALVPLGALALALRGKWDSLEKMVLTVCVTFYVCYLIFILYPVVGPRVYLASIYYLPFDGPIFTPLVNNIVGMGGLFGGAMPSSHCAVALVVIWYLVREFRSATLPLLLLLVLLCLSTVYGRFHYLSDVIVGLITGAIMMAAASYWHGRFAILRARDLESRESEIEPVLEAGVER